MNSLRRYFPQEVHRALSYPYPGVWQPPLNPDTIRLSAGYPFPQSYPLADLEAAFREVIDREGPLALQYLGTSGMGWLHDFLLERSAGRGMCERPADLLVTAGALQGIDLAGRALLQPGDLVAVEAPTYFETLEVLRNYTPDFVSYPVDADGLKVDTLAADLAGRRRAGQKLPKLLYTIANYQNPTGATLSLERRRRLLALAAEYDFLVLEDDAYGMLGFDPPLPTLRALDGSDRVLYFGSLSKVVAPALRIGYVVAHPDLIQTLYLFKKDLDHPLMQAVAARFLQRHDLDRRVAWLQDQYRQRARHLVSCLERHLPPGLTWTAPRGGYFVWVNLPRPVDTVATLREAIAAGVAYVPGHYFFQGGGGLGQFRLSFSYCSAEDFERGTAILGDLVRGWLTT